MLVGGGRGTPPWLLLGAGPVKAGSRAVDLRGPSVYQGGQSLKLNLKFAVFKRVS